MKVVSKQDFYKIFPQKFLRKLKESLVPFGQINKKEILDNLYNEIVTYTYHPQSPREYIVFNKHNFVARIVPTFTAKDYCLYYFATKILEDEIAENRVEGTYGGWRLGNKIRLIEEAEELFIEQYVINSFNPGQWIKYWTEFQRKAWLYSRQYKYMLMFDIANFYDSINLELLKRKIYLVAPKSKHFYIELLFHFLFNWNKILEGYSQKTIGIPQDEIGDSSRLLANFYLQDYDQKMKKLCEQNSVQYLRFADDQILYGNNPQILRKLLFEASKELFKIGLSINSSKVKEFNRETFNVYWTFEMFEMLRSGKIESVNKAIRQFISLKEKGIEFREYSVLKKILNFPLLRKIDPNLKYRLFSIFLDKTFLSDITYWHWNKMYRLFPEETKHELLKNLDELVDEVHFNSFHYNLIKFYDKNSIAYNKDRLNNRINSLKIF